MMRMAAQAGWNLEGRLGLTVNDAQILYSAGSLVLAFALVGVTIWYAISTGRMVAEMRRQNRPYVYIVCEQGRLIVRNSGNRSAHHIRPEILTDAYLQEGELRQEGENQILGLAQVGTSVTIREGIRTLVPGGERHIGQLARPMPARPAVRLEYIVRYQDGAGTEYQEQLAEDYRV